MSKRVSGSGGRKKLDSTTLKVLKSVSTEASLFPTQKENLVPA